MQYTLTRVKLHSPKSVPKSNLALTPLSFMRIEYFRFHLDYAIHAYGKFALRHIFPSDLTHWGRVTHICVGKLTIIDSENGLSPGRRQAIIWTNAGILVIGPLGTNFNEILIEIHTFSFKKMHLKMSSGKRLPFCLGLNVLIVCWIHKDRRPLFTVQIFLVIIMPNHKRNVFLWAIYELMEIC